MTQISTSRGLVEIRELQTIEEMIAAEKIQLQVWGAETSPHPKEMLIPVQHEGGLLAGAFSAGGQMVGLIFHFPTRDSGVVHSQMLAVLEEWRGEGIGRQMKWFQRTWCLERGINRIRWTVDPLRAANAELNIRRLGAVSSTYLPDYYGPMLGIDSGAPSDRLLVEWHLGSERVACRAAVEADGSRLPDTGFQDVQPALAIQSGRPVGLETVLNGAPLLLPLPEHFISLPKANPVLAMAWRMETRAVLQKAFQAGYAINGFTRVGGAAYLLHKGVE